MPRGFTLQSLGWVYLWHFSRPLGNAANVRAQAQHYCGYCNDPDGDGASLERRAAQHLAGRGAAITRAAIAQGIEISLVAAWRAPLSFEKQIKAGKNMPRLCPMCCKARGTRARRIAPAVVEQLALPFDDELTIEPWPAGFDFPAPTILRPTWAEIAYERRARAVGLAMVGGDDWDEGLL